MDESSTITRKQAREALDVYVSYMAGAFPPAVINAKATVRAFIEQEDAAAEIARLTDLHREMRDVAARSAKEKFEAWAEVERLRGLLNERVAIDEIAVLTEDGPMCCCCSAMWEYDYDTTEVLQGTEWHNDGCWVLRVRAALAADDAAPR